MNPETDNSLLLDESHFLEISDEASAQSLMFDSSVEQEIKSVDAAVIAAARGPGWLLSLLMLCVVFHRLVGLFQLVLLLEDF